ncbi:Phospholipase A2, major isoenzyme [Bulinus truncatus]|nr:Phospholipase A2, major isoenzyme [Bulinus truncatus]
MRIFSSLIFCIIAAVLVNLAQGEDRILRRQKRNTAQLCHIINTYNSRHCSAYAAYGCFCGLRSWGSNPVDGSDRCCRQHDHCFASTGCRLLPLLTYSYHCSGSSCTCRDRNRYSCEYRSCQCDIQLAQCLQTASYSGRYYLYSRRNCR